MDVFKSQPFFKRLKSMLKVDFRRIFTIRFTYIMLLIALLSPIIMVIMTTMMDGSISIDPQTGKETVIEGFDNVWEVIGVISNEYNPMVMDMTTMCNINLIYFAMAVVIGVYVSDDFRSGYSKILFTTRAKKSDYIASKTIVLFTVGAMMILLFVLGTILGGAISGLTFETTASATEITMCILSKIFLILVFVGLYFLMSVIGKSRLWLTLILCLGGSMLFFTMIPMITPLDASIVNVLIVLIAGLLTAIGMGLISNVVLNKTSLA